jgi:hypothetical protein
MIVKRFISTEAPKENRTVSIFVVTAVGREGCIPCAGAPVQWYNRISGKSDGRFLDIAQPPVTFGPDEACFRTVVCTVQIRGSYLRRGDPCLT